MQTESEGRTGCEKLSREGSDAYRNSVSGAQFNRYEMLRAVTQVPSLRLKTFVSRLLDKRGHRLWTEP
jgi:hypothetical protein